jgi:glucosamine-6-phosphate deaminase
MAAYMSSETHVESLTVRRYSDRLALGASAAADAAEIIRRAAGKQREVNLLLATGNSQLDFLAELRIRPDIPWPQVNIFHLDEYIGLAPEHPAQFSTFLRRELLNFITPRAFYPVWNRNTDLPAACREYETLLRKFPADVCALGIGENGHLAFNDPPADFQDPAWVKTVDLAESSRRQQVGEGHFSSLEDVPGRAISLTIPALTAARRILAIVPEARKAAAVERALCGPVDAGCPASILRTCPHAVLYLDGDSGARVGGLWNHD